MRTVGVDLAASPPHTAAAVIAWDRTGGDVESPRLRCSDEELLDLLGGLGSEDRAGVDCPFGWPAPFVEAMTAHAEGRPWPGRGHDSTAHRATLRLRRTDVLTHQVMGERARQPLSVSFDRLGATAARWAHLADALAARGRPVDRTGAGRIAEVYPAAARVRWGLAGERSMPALLVAAPYLRCPPDAQTRYDHNEHAFDALIAALIARAVSLGLTPTPQPPDLPTARTEGWIHLPPPASLAQLIR
jgi:hypothetical protein